MLIGSMETLDRDAASCGMKVRRALDYLHEQDFSSMADGMYKIEDGIFANVIRYQTRNAADCYPERHTKSISIQFVAEGEECLGWCPISPDLKVRAPYDEKKDLTVYEALVPDSNVVLVPGCFAVLFPGDVHRPQIALDKPAPVTKVTVMISAALL